MFPRPLLFPTFGFSGFGLSLFQIGLRAGGGGDPLAPGAPSAPILAWTTGVTDNTPGLNDDFDGTVVEGNIVTLEYATNASFTGSTTSTHALTAGEIAAGNVDLALGALADGNWYIRSKIAGSAWSNTVLMTIRAGAASRIGAINMSSPWRGILPIPDGTVAVQDRKIVAGLYGYA